MDVKCGISTALIPHLMTLKCVGGQLNFFEVTDSEIPQYVPCYH